MKKILVINGHPDQESFGAALAQAYIDGATDSGAEIRQIVVAELEFQPNLRFGYRKRTELESDLLRAQQDIIWAEHIVWVFPVWWGSVPAILKGFVDRTFLPGFAFRKKENSLWWEKLLKGRSAHIISTLDQPVWFYWLFNGRPTYHAFKKMTLQFCGITPVRTTTIGPLRLSTDRFREQALLSIRTKGRALK